MLVALTATLFSFVNFGGEGFEIYLNNKVVVQKFGNSLSESGSLRLNQYSANDQLTVKYHHCGKIGKSRTITIKDGQDKIIKLWRFADAATPVAAMNCNVKEILNLNKGNESSFKLYYASSELPGGRLLTNIVVENNIVAKKK